MTARDRSPLLLSALPALAIGMLVARSHGVGFIAFAPNVLALAIAVIASAFIVRAPPATLRSAEVSVLVAAFLGIAATLLGCGLDGVHRWLCIGPLRLNASAAFAPWLFLGLASSNPRHGRIALLLALATQLVHAAQPDAAQSTALAVGVLPLVADTRRIDSRIGIALSVALLGLAAVAWLRPDPLVPLDHVERILFITASKGAAWITAAAAAIACLLIPAVMATRSPDASTARVGYALLLYLTASFAVTLFRNYPVPVFGAGAGPVLGWSAATMILQWRHRADPPRQP